MFVNPIPVPILAVDPGKRSGWASFRPITSSIGIGAPWDTLCGWAVFCGSCDLWGRDTETAVHRAVNGDQAKAIVIEAPGVGGGGRFLNMVLGLGEAIGVWRYLWRQMTQTRTMELDAVQVSWRAGILGGTSSAHSSADWKKLSIREAKAIAGWKGSPWNLVVLDGGDFVGEQKLDSEMSDALLMGWWALHSPALADVLGPRFLKSIGWDDNAECLEAKHSMGHSWMMDARERKEVGSDE